APSVELRVSLFMSQSVDERLFHAHDSYSSAILMSSLVLVGQIVALASTGVRPQGVPLEARFAVTIMALLALGYLLATHRRPRERAAWAVCAILVAMFLVLVPWAAVRWEHLGRPWEAFVLPQIAIMGLGLTMPRSFWLGTVAVLAFVLEGLGIYVYF